MANLISALAGKLVPRLDDKLRGAEERLADLERQLSEAALDDALGKAGAAEKLAALNAELRGVREAVAGLRAAQRLAADKDAAAERAARARLQNSQLAAMQSHARARIEATAECATAIEAAAKAYRRLIESTDKMMRAVPIGTSLPDGMAIESPATLIAAEMWRHSGATQPGAPTALPGAATTMDFWCQPEKIEPAVDVVKRSTEWIVSLIKEQIAACPPADSSSPKEGTVQ